MTGGEAFHRSPPLFRKVFADGVVGLAADITGVSHLFGGEAELVREMHARLAGTVSVADILMADVLRLVDRCDGLEGHSACRGHVARATARPSFVKAHADQMAHFSAAG